jgi:hypothetical protein
MRNQEIQREKLVLLAETAAALIAGFLMILGFNEIGRFSPVKLPGGLVHVFFALEGVLFMLLSRNARHLVLAMLAFDAFSLAIFWAGLMLALSMSQGRADFDVALVWGSQAVISYALIAFVLQGCGAFIGLVVRASRYDL